MTGSDHIPLPYRYKSRTTLSVIGAILFLMVVRQDFAGQADPVDPRSKRVSGQQKRERAVPVQLLALNAGQQPRPTSRPGGQVPARPLPLDPLTAEEKAEAIRVASSDSRVKETLGRGRSTTINAEFLALKSDSATGASDAPVGRHAAVIFYRYDDDKGVRAVVDLTRRAVSELSVMDGASVPLAIDEVVQASSLALRNEQVRSALGSSAQTFRVQTSLSGSEPPQNRVEGLRMVALSPNDPCYKQRCVSLLFRQGRSYIVGLSVVVNLTRQDVTVERKPR
jgi:hypothetical protein